MADWLFSWKGFLAGAAILLGAVVVGFLLRESTLGNVASIVGLAVSVLGFIVTIRTVIDARQQIKEASDRAEQAVAQARQETRHAVEGIAAQLTATDCAALRYGVEDLRQACQDEQWPRAIYRCQDSGALAYRLAFDRRLTAGEVLALRTAVDNLRLVRRFIERNRMAGQTGSLPEGRLQGLDDMIALLAQIQARLHHEPLQQPEAPTNSE